MVLKGHLAGRLAQLSEFYVHNVLFQVFIVVVHLLSHAGLCDPLDCSMPGSSVLHYLLEFAQVYVRSIRGAVTISSSEASFSFLPSVFPSIRVSSKESAKGLVLRL